MARLGTKHTIGKATSASLSRIPEDVVPLIPEKLIDKNAGKELKMDAFGKVRKHPIRVIDVPSNTISMHISEILPGSRTGLHRHHNEAIVYILSGHGYSEVQGRRVDWEEGDALYIPPWSWHAHYNKSKDKPARYLAATNSPLLQNMGGIDRKQEMGLVTFADVAGKGEG